MAVRVEKLTISLPKKDLEEVKKYEQKLGLSRSAVVRQAVEQWLRLKKNETLAEKYARVFGNRRTVEKHRELSEESLAASRERWPEY